MCGSGGHLIGWRELSWPLNDNYPDLIQALAVVRLDPYRGMQAEAVGVSAQGLTRRGLALHRAPQGQPVAGRARRKPNRPGLALIP